MCLRRTRIEPSSCARRLSASLSGAKLAGAKPRAQGIFGNDKISTELALDSDRRAKKINALDQAAPLAGWQLPEGFMTLRRLLEARMGKQGKREFVQVLRLMEVFSADEVAAAVRNAIARGAIGFDAVKHLVLCRIERRPPRLDMTVYPYLPQAHVAMTSAKTYLGLLTRAAS